MAGAGAAGGALWGGLIGLIFLMPLFGMAIGGGGRRGRRARSSDAGVDDKFMKELGEQLDAGQRGRHRARPQRDDGQGARGDPDPGPHHPDVARQRGRGAPGRGARRRGPLLSSVGRRRSTTPAGDGAAAPPRQRVEISVPARTLLQLLGFAALVALAILSLGTLISILLAAVLAVGLDPVVGALVRRGWNRGRASVVVFAALFVAVFVLVLVTAGPVWDQIVEFVHQLPGFWDKLTSKPGFQDILSTANADEHVKPRSRSWPRVCRTRRARCSASPAACSAPCCSSSR